ncbi:MAG TPA: PDZ domain-containing protein [Cyclobacteriaceae bacterium]|nr:PDZ domain-containing protein [Cyclobacteriaceae bacterium]
MKLKLLFCIQLIIQSCFGQPKMGYWLTSNVVRIPFEIVNNSLLVEVTLNEHKNLSFIIDTGSNYSVAFTDSLFQIPTQQKTIPIQGFGNADSLFAHISIANSVRIKGLITEGKQLLVIDKSEIGLQQFYDRPVHGVIGLDILRHFDMEINFSSEKIILRKNGVKTKTSQKWKKVPFHLTEFAIIIPSTLAIGRKKEALYLLLDTGSELPILLQETFCPEASSPTIIGMGILGYASGRIGRIQKINFGEIEITNMIAAFPDSASSKWNSSVPQQGNLGIQFLKKYRTIINYTEGYLQLKSIKSADESFQYNRSGIAVETSSQAECPYYISQIAPGSPAEIAGLLRGDKILFVDQVHCAKLTLQQINEYFITNKNTRHNITVLRGNVPKYFIIKLKDDLH